MATVSKTDRITIVTLASASAGPFDMTFRLFDDDALDVYVNNLPRTDYTISSAYVDGYDDNATITFDAPLADADVIRIHGDLTPGRANDYLNGPGLTDKMNIEQGRLWSAMAEVKRDTKRSLRVLGNSVVPYAPTTGYMPVWATDRFIDGGNLAEFENGLAALGGRLYASYAAAAAAEPLLVIDVIFVKAAHRLLKYMRKTGATALITADGATWAPGEDATFFHYGITGDGVADDTVRVQAACNGGHKKIREVYAKMRLTNKITVPNGVFIEGSGYDFSRAGITDADDVAGTVFICDFDTGTADAVFDFERGSGMSRCIGYDPSQDATRPSSWTPNTTPWFANVGTVAEGAYTVRDMGVVISDVMAIDFTHGLRLQKGAEQGLIERFQTNAFTVGIDADACYDLVRIVDCHIWPLGGNTTSQQANEREWTLNNRSAYRFGRVDGLIMDRCFSINNKNGVEFYPSESGDAEDEKATTNFRISNCYFDGNDRAIWVHGTYAAGWFVSGSFNNCMLFHKNDALITSESATIVIEEDFGSIRINGGEIQAGGFTRTGSSIEVTADLGHLMIDGVDITGWDDASTGAPLVNKTGNARVTITEDNTFRSNAGQTFTPLNGLINGDSLGDVIFGGIAGENFTEYATDGQAFFQDMVVSSDTQSHAATFRGKKSRGTLYAPTAVQTGTTLVTLSGIGRAADASFSSAGQLDIYAASISGNNVVGGMRGQLKNTAGSIVEAWRALVGGLFSLGAGVTTFQTTRAAAVTWASGKVPTVGTIMVISDVNIAFRYTGSGTEISDLAGWIPYGNVTPNHYASNTTPGTTDMTAAMNSALNYVAGLGGGTVHLLAQVYAMGYIHWYQNMVDIVGLGGGYTTAEHIQRDKAKFLPNAPTRLLYNGAVNGIFIDRRPLSHFSRKKLVGGVLRNVTVDGLSGTNKCGIAIRETMSNKFLAEDVVVFGATSRSIDLTGSLTSFSAGDKNSAYSTWNRVIVHDKLLTAAGVNLNGGGVGVVIGAEYNATNTYLDDLHITTSSGAVDALVVENSDHAAFGNVRCNTGKGVFHADDTGTFGALRFVRYKGKVNGGFAVGDTVTDATSAATGTVVEVREAEGTTLGALFLSGATGTFGPNNLQVSGTTRGVGENRSHMKIYNDIGAIQVGDSVAGAAATFLVNEIFRDPATPTASVIFANAGDVTGTFVAGENLQVSAVTEAACTEVVQTIGIDGFWSTQRIPVTLARFVQADRWFGDLTVKASVAGSIGSRGNNINYYSVVDAFSIGYPVVETGSTLAKSGQVKITADCAPGEFATNNMRPTSFGGQAAQTSAHRAASFSHATTGTWIAVPWDTDLGGTHDAVVLGTSTTNFVVPTGVSQMRMYAKARFGFHATGQRGVRFRINAAGGQMFGPMRVNAAGAGETDLTINSVGWVNVTPGDLVRLEIYQDSGGALSMTAGGTSMQIEWR